MTLKHEKRNIMLAGLVIGVIASLLVLFGNPKNMGFCIACFLRDTAGALGLHSAEAVQYIRPEIIGLVFGSFLMALAKKEFSPRGGSAPVTRFVLGMFVMVGSLMFLGCPFRMILRIAGGDINAICAFFGAEKSDTENILNAAAPDYPERSALRRPVLAGSRSGRKKADKNPDNA